MSSLIPRNVLWHGLARRKPRGWFHHLYWFITPVQNYFKRKFFFSGKLWSPNHALARLQKASWSHTKYSLAILKPRKRRDKHTVCPWSRARGEFWGKCVHLKVIKQLEEGFSLGDFALLEITGSWSYLWAFTQAESTLILIRGAQGGAHFPRLKEKIPQVW